MRKKILKIIILIIYVILTLSVLSNVYAGTISESFNGNLGSVEEKTTPIITILSAILFVIRIVGVSIATVILMVIGCKYMVASAGDRADIKKYAMSYIIGAIVMFGAAGIAAVLQEIITNAFAPTGP